MTTKEKILDISMLLGAAAAIIISVLGRSFYNMDKAPDNAFRLHIIAASDSYEDQKIKYELRDHLLSALGDIFSGCHTKEEAKNAAQENLDTVKTLTESFLREKKYTYSAKCVIEKSDFPTRAYSGYTLPAGSYDALKITLGSGEGRNWWCVLYPSMCVEAASMEIEGVFPKNMMYEEKKRSTALTADSINNRRSVEIKFALYELLRKIFL